MHKLVNSATDLSFVLLVDLVYCLFNEFVLSRVSIGCMLLLDCSEVAQKTPRWHRELWIKSVFAAPFTDVQSGEDEAEDDQRG